MNTQKCISDTDLGRLCEGDLTSPESQALQQHIEACLGCKARWQQVTAGARHLEQMLIEPARKAAASGKCLSAGVLAGFVDQTLDDAARGAAEEHLAKCPNCRDALADKFSAAYEVEGDTWWSQYVRLQVLGLLVQLSEEEINSICEELNTAPAPAVRSEAIIKLSIFKPAEGQARPLAAATGEGASEQKLHQDEPPFDFHLVKFGEQLRIGVRSAVEESEYDNCLGRLELLEAGSCVCSRVILIDKGEGQCILEPHEIPAVRPAEGTPGIRFVPITTLAEPSSTGSEVYRPIFERLLGHKEPQIRRSAVEVTARIYGPQAESLIRPLAEDGDKTVRLAVQKALERFPRQ